MVFGGDDLNVENLIGHADVPRKGISIALSEIDSIVIAEKIVWKNAAEIYGID
jgi:hypothetical protein